MIDRERKKSDVYRRKDRRMAERKCGQRPVSHVDSDWATSGRVHPDGSITPPRRPIHTHIEYGHDGVPVIFEA